MTLPISVIIPTFNEEKYLPKLLISIKEQSVKPKEIIVADANSKDNTPRIARKYHCKLVEGIGSPARGRNNGAKKASQKYLFFLDADVVLPFNFFERAFQEIKSRKLDVGSCLGLLTSSRFDDKGIIFVTNKLLLTTEKISPHSGQSNIFIKRSIHKKINGFDEGLFLAEDHDYISRASKLGKHGYIRSVKLYFSHRRFESEGRIRLTFKYAYSIIYRLLFGEIRREIYKYEFGKHREAATIKQPGR